MMILAALARHHRTPSGVFLVVLILLAALYVAWRTGRLPKLSGSGAAATFREALRENRVSPLALLPLVVLVIVVVVLLIAR